MFGAFGSSVFSYCVFSPSARFLVIFCRVSSLPPADSVRSLCSIWDLRARGDSFVRCPRNYSSRRFTGFPALSTLESVAFLSCDLSDLSTCHFAAYLLYPFHTPCAFDAASADSLLTHPTFVRSWVLFHVSSHN